MPKKQAPDVQQKLRVLAAVGKQLNQAGVVWAVGASALLYLNGLVADFHDIDIMTTEADAAHVRQTLSKLGKLCPPRENLPQYRTACFLEYLIDGVELDVMAGFAIVSEGVCHDCSLQLAHITARAMVGDVAIPLQSLSDWKRYYTLMGRSEKVALLGGVRI